jgi:hypothetical protein
MPDDAPDEDRFAALAAQFQDRFTAVRGCVDKAYVRPDWAARNAELERDLLPVPPADFLRHPAIRFQMFVDDRVLAHELPFVRSRLGSDNLLAEDPAGSPPTVALAGTSFQTSSNTVHQLHHLLRYEQATGKRVRDANTIVEWGGGFGSLMRLAVRLHAGNPTCLIFDTPIFSALQWLYLAAVLGSDCVVLHAAGPVRPVEGCVNVAPIGLLADTDVDADLFISNWALNESTPAAQEAVLSRKWFNADSLLLAMNAGDPLTRIACDAGARPVPVGDFMPGQQYLVT